MLTIKVEALAGDDLKESMVEMLALARLTNCQIELRGNGMTFWVYPNDEPDALREAFDRLYCHSTFISSRIRLPK